MRILLTGATGFLGFRTLEKLVDNTDVEYIVANGNTIKGTHYIEHKKVGYKLGNLCDAALVNELTKNIDCIINAAALSAPWGRFTDFYAANVTTQRNLIEAAQRNGVKRFIYISSPSVYYTGKDRLNIKETDPLPKHFVNAYAQTKREAELILKNAGIDYTILRPRALIGRGDTVIMPRVIKAYLDGRLKVIGDGNNIVDLTSVANMVSAIMLSLSVGSTGINQVYNISDGSPVRLWDCIEIMLLLLGYDFKRKNVPFYIIHNIARLLEIKANITDHKEPVLTKYGVGILAKSFTLDIAKAVALLNYRPTVTIDESITEFVEWYKKL